MKINIIWVFIINLAIVYLLLVMDNAILMYYIFWFNNIFIVPLLWICIKIIYYNRTILLFLLFYYFIAKYTIKLPGYKYFYFFNIDVRKVRAKYLNYVCNITGYHIELISIFFFFLIILMPLILHIKEFFFSICCLFLFIFLLWRIAKNKFKYIIEKRIKVKNILFSIFFFLICLKFFNFQIIKDLYILYFHFDKWAFELLEWKLQMYVKIMEKDYYSDTVGLKPKWTVEKYSKKFIADKEYWDYLSKKRKNYLIKELKYNLKRTKYKYYLFIKYHEKTLTVKNYQSLKKIEKLRKELLFKNYNFKKGKVETKGIVIKECIKHINIKRENPVVTQEKERERLLHHTYISNIIHKFSLNNYYILNLGLKELTFNKLYYQPFIDKKSINKYIIEEKRAMFYKNIKERITFKEDLILYKAIKEKMKKIKIVKNTNKHQVDYSNTNKKLYEKIFSYLKIEKGKKKINNLFKFFKIKEKRDNKSVNKFLKNIRNDIRIKGKINILSSFHDSNDNIKNNENFSKIKKKLFFAFSTYIEKEKLEKIDNKVLFNTVNKYNEEKTKANWKNEFRDVLILKEKKENMKIGGGPDLSRRQKK